MALKNRPLVLVPGACLGGWAWREVAERLRRSGHEVFPLTLTGLGERAHLAGPAVDLNTHVRDVANALDFEDLQEAILVGHSYAGAVITAVAAERPARLNAVVYLDTGPLPGGVAIIELMNEEQRELHTRAVSEQGEGWLWPVPDEETLRAGTFGSASGLSDAHLQLLRERGTAQPEGTFTTPLTLGPEPVDGVRRVAIFCSDGGVGLEAVRRLLADRDPRVAAFADPDWELHELAAGHWPMFSLPGPLAELLHGLAAGRL